jgi:hypothetical protein
MKKTTKKTTAAKPAAAKTPVAATKTAEPAAKSATLSAKTAEAVAKVSAPTPAPKASEPAPKAASPKPAVVKATSSAAVAAAAPAKKKVAAVIESPATQISAKVDIGFGNHLYLRGSGPGLSWDRGIAMDCVAADIWTASLRDVKEPVSFKLLINDMTWSTGNDFVVEPGQSITVSPTF